MPAWYTNAKFGIFIHWGVYSMPAFAAVNLQDENHTLSGIGIR
jgi:alpha-L-fucosidase